MIATKLLQADAKERRRQLEKHEGCIWCGAKYMTEHYYLKPLPKDLIYVTEGGIDYLACPWHYQMYKADWFGRRSEMQKIVSGTVKARTFDLPFTDF